MAMWIQDDYWEAAQAMPEKQRAPFLLAVVAYGMEGVEPKGNPTWLPTFLVIKKRIELSSERSEKGRKMAEARWGKRDAQASSKADAQQRSSICTSICTSNAAASEDDDAEDVLQHYAESEREIGIEITPLNPPFAWQCLNQLNEALGTTYSSMPPKCTRTLDRFAGKYTPEEVRQMVEYKRGEWQGSRFRNCLTPNTLFSPDHFEQYMNQSRSSAAEKRDYEQYD